MLIGMEFVNQLFSSVIEVIHEAISVIVATERGRR